MNFLEDMSIKIFADGADKRDMMEMYSNSYIKGLTTNPTLMRKAGVTDYKRFALDVLSDMTDKPISFEVFSDELIEIERQAHEIASWGSNVYVKIPITNTKQESCCDLVSRLSLSGIKVNVTAIMTLSQVEAVAEALSPNVPSYVSVFAGRIADTGRDPVPMMKKSISLLEKLNLTELIWASPRELLNIFQADEIGCHIITATPDIIGKLKLVGYDLDDYSLDTVKMFFKDATSAGFKL
jgi:transaldolase